MIRPLRESDDPSGFSCGTGELDIYLRRHALANALAGASVTYVLEAGQLGIAGFVTLAAAGIRTDELGASHLVGMDWPRYPLPALLIARLAVDERCQHQGLGRSLLAFAFEEALIARDRIGCIGVLVDSKPEAVSFYRGFGFSEVRVDDPRTDVRRLFLGAGALADAIRSG